MKQVVLEYAGAVIAVLGAISFFLVFHQFFVGREGVLGQMLMYSIGENSMAENEAFDAYKEKPAPVFVEKDQAELIVNQKCLLADYCEAKDWKGEELPVFINRAWTEDGEEVSFRIWEDGQLISFSNAGVYFVEVYAVDENQRQTNMVLKLFVNER